MPSGSLIYTHLLLLVAIALGIPLGLRFLSRFVFKVERRCEKVTASSAIEVKDENIETGLNSRFFIALHFGAVMSALLLLIFPVSSVFRNAEHPGTLLRALILVFFASLFLGIALILVERRHDLKWQKSHQGSEKA